MWQRVRITDHRRQHVFPRRAADGAYLAGACLAGAWLAGMLLASTLAGLPGRVWAEVAAPSATQAVASDRSGVTPTRAPATKAAETGKRVVVPLALPAAPEQAPATTAGDAPAAEVNPEVDADGVAEPESGTGVPEAASETAPEIRLVMDAAALYDVAVPVPDQSERARRQGGRAALRMVLMRLTGIVDLPPSEALAAADRNPERLFARFGYQTEPQIGPRTGLSSGLQQSAAHSGSQSGEPLAPPPAQLRLRVTFSQSALFQLIREARLPVWPSARPRMRIWLFVDAGGDQYNLGGRAEEPAFVAATERAAQWGLPVLIDPTPALPEAEARPEVGRDDASEQVSARLWAPQSIALRPAQAAGWPVWPVVSIWSASRDDLAALSSAPATGFDAVLRLRGSAPAPTPTPSAMPENSLVEASGAAADTLPVPNADGSPLLMADGSSLPSAAAQPALITGDAAAIWQGTLEINDPAVPAAVIAAGDPPAPGTGALQAASAPLTSMSTQHSPVPAATRIDLGAGPAATLAAAAVDRLVAHLLPRFQVVPGAQGTLSLQVAGIRSVADYASVLQRLAAVEVIDDVRVAGAMGDRVDFRITTGAQVTQLAAVLGTDGRLRPQQPAADVTSADATVPAAAPVPTSDLVLEWQGG